VGECVVMDIKKNLSGRDKKWLIIAAAAILVVVIAILVWQLFTHHKNDNLYSSNGRIEGTEIDIAPRIGQKIKEMLAREGDLVEAGQIVVRMNTDVLEAELKEAEAKLLQAISLVAVSEKDLLQKQSEKEAAEAQLQQYEAELENAEKTLGRSSQLAPEGGASQQEFDNDTSRYKSALSAKKAAQAKVNTAHAGVATVQEQIIGAKATVAAAHAAIGRVKTDINDSMLVCPRGGRVQFRVAQIGEVVPTGGRILRILDLTDIYMTFFLPTDLVGRIPIGDEARIVLDAFPDFIIPAYISFISDVAQFTPKTVETKTEREKLMFRLRAQVPVDFLKKHINEVKTGLPGVAYLRIDKSKPWPKFLEYRDEH
jgi:HlyD family secretion protein